MILNCWIGWDRREHLAFDVACDSIARRASRPVAIHKLDADDLFQKRLLWRPVAPCDGHAIDQLSDAPQSTAFATSRFLIPYLQRSGWAMFADCDVVFLSDLADLFEQADSRYAVMCVKHKNLHHAGLKMDGQVQTVYPRKNWSSVVLWNTEHPAHMRMPLAMLNQWPGELLHRFSWLRDSEIGALDPAWNWLVNVEPKPYCPKVAHFTMGGPWLPGWQSAEHDEIWNDAYRVSNSHAAAG